MKESSVYWLLAVAGCAAVGFNAWLSGEPLEAAIFFAVAPLAAIALVMSVLVAGFAVKRHLDGRPGQLKRALIGVAVAAGLIGGLVALRALGAHSGGEGESRERYNDPGDNNFRRP